MKYPTGIIIRAITVLNRCSKFKGTGNFINGRNECYQGRGLWSLYRNILEITQGKLKNTKLIDYIHIEHNIKLYKMHFAGLNSWKSNLCTRKNSTRECRT